jgi:hypothetical protein
MECGSLLPLCAPREKAIRTCGVASVRGVKAVASHRTPKARMAVHKMRSSYATSTEISRASESDWISKTVAHPRRKTGKRTHSRATPKNSDTASRPYGVRTYACRHFFWASKNFLKTMSDMSLRVSILSF